MATEQYEDDIELDDDIVDDGDDLDLEILDEDDVDYDGDYDDANDDANDVDVVDDDVEDEEEEEEEGEEEAEAKVEVDKSKGAADDAEEDDDDVVDLDDDDEEEDEETLEVLLGPDSDTTPATPRKRPDESGDAPPGEGEFTCRSCFLVKRRPQLADAEAMICLDCA